MSEVKTNKISSLASDNDITIDPDGTGDVLVAAGHKLGVGTAPERDLHVKGASGDPVHFKLEGDASDYARIMFDDGTTDNIGELRYNFGSDYMSFNTNSAERMRIDSSGTLLLGQTTGTIFNQSSVTGITAGGSGSLQVTGSAATVLYLNRLSTGQMVGIYKDGGQVGSISITASSTAYNTSSDYRLKENVTYDWDATTRLKQLKPARFNFIVDADTTVDGFLAHEAQAVVPEAVTGTHNEVDDDGNPVMQGIDQSKLVPLLVKTIQELEARIAALETE